MAVEEVPDADAFRREVLEPAGPMVVAFWAEWCPFCRRFRPWFLQIVRNQCRDAVRHRRVIRRVEVPEHLLDRAMERVGAEDQAHRRREAHDVLWKGLVAIEAIHREVLVMKELEGLGYAEIARALDIPEGTVASRLYHARRALREALEARGVTYP